MREIGNGFIRRVNEGVSLGTGVSKQIAPFQLATNDTAAAVEGAGFFNALVKDMPIGTPIFASLDLDGTPVFKNYMVTANDGTVVTIALQTTTAG